MQAEDAGRLASPLTEGLGPAPRWWHCDTHGPGSHPAWGCPECVREMRGEKLALQSEVDRLIMELAKTRQQLRLAVRGLKHCAGWNINDDKRAALMAVVLESEAMLDTGPNVRAEATREAWCPGAAQDNGACDCPARRQGATPRGVASRARG